MVGVAAERESAELRSRPETKGIFVSYAHEDHTKAQALILALEKMGWEVWWDDHLKGGEEYVGAINRMLAAARCVIVLWSRSAASSPFVRGEALEGWNRGTLLPVLLEDDAPLAVPFNTTQAVRLTGWPHDPLKGAFDELVAAVAGKLEAIPGPQIHRRPLRMWIPALLLAAHAVATVALIRTLFFHYHSLRTLSAGVIALGLLVAVGVLLRSPLRLPAEIALRRWFFAKDRRIRPPALLAAMVTMALLGTGVILAQPSLAVTIGPVSEEDRERFHPNRMSEQGGRVRPADGFVVVTMDTGFNRLDEFELAVTLRPYGEVEFAVLRIEENLRSDGEYDFDMLAGAVVLSGERFRGEGRVLVRWKEYAFGSDASEDPMLHAVLRVGEWTDETAITLD